MSLKQHEMLQNIVLYTAKVLSVCTNGRACCEEHKLIHHHQHHDHHSVVQLNNSETYVYNRRTECDIHDSVSTYSSSKINLTSYA